MPRIGFLLALCVASGCTATPKSGINQNADPLLGSTVAPVNATPLAINPASSGNPASALPPLTQSSPTSTAVLANGAYPPLVGGRDLRIGAAPTTAGGNRIQPPHQNPPGVLAVVTADPNPLRPVDHAAPGVVPLDASGARPVSSTNNPVWTSSGGLDQAFATLAGYSPKWHRLENVGPGAWRFSCSIPDRAEPNKSRTYEVEGTSAIQAVQNALVQIGR